ncbi:MAG: hypothetical protein ACKO1J_05305 [Tagaea sp.]
MNRAWMALAALAALGVTAVALELRSHAFAGMSAAECARLYEEIAVGERNDPASAKFARDIFRLTGMCAPREMVSAMNDIYAALNGGLDESAILLYADALLNAGQGKRAAPWIRSAVAIALTSKGILAGPFGESEFYEPWLIRAVDRTSAALNSGNPRRIAAELEAYLARPPRAPYAELRVTRLALARLERADPQESLYWRGRFHEWILEFRPDGLSPWPSYAAAVRCGDRRAMRRLAIRYLTGAENEDGGSTAYYGLVLIQNPTAEERALRDALEPRFGETPLDMTNPLMRAARARTHDLLCESALNGIAGRQR